MKIHSSINLIKMKNKLLLIVVTAALLFFPNINFGQAPNLGTAANFVLFSSVGAIGNTGISQVTGNVGTNSGAITGFGNVNGVMHTVDGASALCTTDLISAYNQLNATVPTLFPGTLLGNGVILTPGVYSTPSATTLNLDLILDAQGNSSAVFIFQIHGTFSTNTNSKIKLINGAKACNVFWQIEGLTSMATGTTMRGTVIVNNAAINMNTSDTLEGRALSTAGAVNVDGVLAYTPIGCGSPLLTGPIAPTLASAACYALFSSDGPVTNVGVTHVIGDVGTNLGSATGYNPLFVTGMIHGVPDGSTAACATDLLNAYNYLNTLPFNIELLYPAQFGHGLVLTPHTYRMNSAVTFTDSLYLNAENDANAVFVIQVKGAFSTSVNSKVILINGAQSKNVFWNIDGAVSINTNSIFRGTIICNNGAMNLNTNVTLDGRALTTTGALNTSAVNVVMPPGCGSAPTTTITTQPTNQVTCTGGSVSFSVIASGTGLTYQWRKGTTNLINGGNISGATTATLTINPVTIADTSSFYNVIVGGTPNDTSINVSLLLNTPSAIILQPVSQAVCMGSSVSFSVVATGIGLTYQWHKGLVSLINGGNISGATTGTLTINPTTISDTSSLYYVVIAGGCSNDTSIKVSLHFNNPTIVNQPTNQIACLGSSVSFSVSATGAGLIYQWRKGITNLINGANISGANTPTLTINPVTAADTSSFYNVIISGSCLPNDTSINVSLRFNNLNIITQPSNQTGCSGSAASFSVSATGAGLTYQWHKGIVSLINAGNISGATTATLIINPATISDTSSFYYIVITGNCVPNDTSVKVSLHINSLPIVTANSSITTVCAGSSVTLTGGGATSYTWTGGVTNGISFVPVSTNTYTVTGTNGSNCSNTATITVSVNSLPVAVPASNSPVCTGSSLNLTAQTIAGATYFWSGPNLYTSSVQNPTIVSTTSVNAGIYSLTVSNNGCSKDSVITVVVNNCGGGVTDLSIIKTVNNVHPLLGSTVVFVVTATNNGPNTATGVTVTDILQNGYNYVASTITTGTYNPSTGTWVIGTLNSGASAVLTVTVTVVTMGNYVNTAIIYGNEVDPNMVNNNSSVETFPSDFFIPEGFSPNGDGINDVFFIRGIDNYPNNVFTVFNRWGDKIFTASPYQNNWDGKTTMGVRVGGDELPVGTYFYTLDLGDGSKVFKGTIYLNK
jgi:gliding motility-associated-like protein/uncharacterized repeat protein (TIGR01451 family)